MSRTCHNINVSYVTDFVICILQISIIRTDESSRTDFETKEREVKAYASSSFGGADVSVEDQSRIERLQREFDSLTKKVTTQVGNSPDENSNAKETDRPGLITVTWGPICDLMREGGAKARQLKADCYRFVNSKSFCYHVSNLGEKYLSDDDLEDRFVFMHGHETCNEAGLLVLGMKFSRSAASVSDFREVNVASCFSRCGESDRCKAVVFSNKNVCTICTHNCFFGMTDCLESEKCRGFFNEQKLTTHTQGFARHLELPQTSVVNGDILHTSYFPIQVPGKQWCRHYVFELYRIMTSNSIPNVSSDFDTEFMLRSIKEILNNLSPKCVTRCGVLYGSTEVELAFTYPRKEIDYTVDFLKSTVIFEPKLDRQICADNFEGQKYDLQFECRCFAEHSVRSIRAFPQRDPFCQEFGPNSHLCGATWSLFFSEHLTT